MSIININSPTNNLQHQMANIQVMNIASDYKRVRVSKITDRVYESKLEEFYNTTMPYTPMIRIPVLSLLRRCFIFFIIVLTGRRKKPISKKTFFLTGMWYGLI